MAAYVKAVMMLDAAFPGNGYAADAAAMAEALSQAWHQELADTLPPFRLDYAGSPRRWGTALFASIMAAVMWLVARC